MIYLNKISPFFRNEKLCVAAILFVAYVVRVLPYLLGYDIPFADEGMRDFTQVKYLSDFGQIHLYGSYFDYGAFPVLHILVYGLYVLSDFELLKIYLFVPQVFACLGLLFFYLFSKKYFSNQISLWALFLIAIFIPHIYWSAQPIRETMGLFFFPLVIYLFDQYFGSGPSVSLTVGRWLRLMAIFILMIMSHYGSALFIIGWIMMYTMVFIDDKKKALVAWLTIGGVTFISLVYWALFFRRGIFLLQEILSVNPFFLLVGASTIILIFLKLNVIKQWLNLNRIKSPALVIVLVATLLIFFRAVVYNILPIAYPPQIWVQFMVLGFLIMVGFFVSRDRITNNLVLACLYFPVLWGVALYHFYLVHNLRDIPFDPFRTLEFIFSPMSILAAQGLVWAIDKIKIIRLPLIIFFVVSATFAYPSIFIFKTDFFGTPFYDVRSNIRYIPNEVRELVDWANDQGYSVSSSIVEIEAYQAMLFPPHAKHLYIVTNNDLKISGEFNDYIKDPIVGITNFQELNQEKYYDLANIVYRNNSGYLVKQNYFDAKIVSSDIPQATTVGEARTLTVTIKNSGTTAWLPALNFELRDVSGQTFKRVEKKILPGEEYEFRIITRYRGSFRGVYETELRMFQESIGWFGDSLKVSINVEAK
ncbi:MAG: hypothetical protein PHW95_01730 [Patescibacteria group bacterium]|nr:hypothetical protein [Patescibacteria group bacterium]